jgi:hypothetical protein
MIKIDSSPRHDDLRAVLENSSFPKILHKMSCLIKSLIKSLTPTNWTQSLKTRNYSTQPDLSVPSQKDDDESPSALSAKQREAIFRAGFDQYPNRRHSIPEESFLEACQKNIQEEEELAKSKKNIDLTTIFKDTLNSRKEAVSLDLLINRLRTRFEVFWNPVNFGSVARNIVAATIVPGTAASTAVSAFAVLAILGGMVLALTGAVISVVNTDSLADAISHMSREKIFTSLLNILVGLEALVAGVCFIASQIGSVMSSAAAGFVLPWVALALYVTLIFSVVYKIGVGLKFRFELQEKLGNLDNPLKAQDNLLQALEWLREKTELSQTKEAKAVDEGENVFERISASLHTKWDEFALRTGKEVFEIVDQVKLNNLIKRLRKNDPTALEEAKALTNGVLESNRKMLKWSGISLVSCLIGLAGVAVCLASAGHIASIVSSALFASAAFISIFTDSPTVRETFERKIVWIKDSISSVSLEKTVEKIRSKVGSCFQSTKVVEEGSCASMTSSTISSPKKDSLPTRLLHMGVTYGLSQVS